MPLVFLVLAVVYGAGFVITFIWSLVNMAAYSSPFSWFGQAPPFWLIVLGSFFTALLWPVIVPFSVLKK